MLKLPVFCMHTRAAQTAELGRHQPDPRLMPHSFQHTMSWLRWMAKSMSNQRRSSWPFMAAFSSVSLATAAASCSTVFVSRSVISRTVVSRTGLSLLSDSQGP
eukprot:UN4427